MPRVSDCYETSEYALLHVTFNLAHPCVEIFEVTVSYSKMLIQNPRLTNGGFPLYRYNLTMNKPTNTIKKPSKLAQVAKPSAAASVKSDNKPNRTPRPATTKKDKAPKNWPEALKKWRGGDKLPAPIHCVVYQLVAMAYSQKRPELLKIIPEEWQELAQKRYADPQFKHQK